MLFLGCDWGIFLWVANEVDNIGFIDLAAMFTRNSMCWKTSKETVSPYRSFLTNAGHRH